MKKLKKAPLYVKTSDDLPGNFHEVKFHLGFQPPTPTIFTFGLVEEVEYDTDSLNRYVLSYKINDDEYFLSLNPQGKVCLTQTGGIGLLHEAFLLFENMDTALEIPKVTPKPHDGVSAYTIYKITESEDGKLIFNAVYKNDYIKSYS